MCLRIVHNLVGCEPLEYVFIQLLTEKSFLVQGTSWLDCKYLVLHGFIVNMLENVVVITKLVANCKDDVWLIKMVNFKAAILFIRILTCLISHRTFGNVIYDNAQKCSELFISKLRKLEKLSIKLKKADHDITVLPNCKVVNVITKFLAFNYQTQMIMTQDLSENGYCGLL